VSRFTKITLRIVATLFAAAAAFCAGFILAGAYYDRWLVPGLVKKYPHDGQIGLEIFVRSMDVAYLSAAAVFLIGIIWTVKTSKRPAEN
jgi:hypothetical protein